MIGCKENSGVGEPTPERDFIGLTYSLSEKLNSANRSPMAGLLTGTYGLFDMVIGLGKLSRLRRVIVSVPQFRSMNLRIET